MSPLEDRSILSRIKSFKFTIGGLSIKEASEKINDTSIDFKDRCDLAKSIARLRNLEAVYVKKVIDFVGQNAIKNENISGAECSGVLLSLSRSNESVKMFAKDIVLFLDKRSSPISDEDMQVLVKLGDAAQPFMQQIVAYALNKTTMDERSIRVLSIFNKTLLLPYEKDIVARLKDDSLSLNARSSAASLLAHSELIEAYISDVQELISSIVIFAKQNYRNRRFDKFYLLETLDKAAKYSIKEIASLLNPEDIKNMQIRLSAAIALINTGSLAKPYINNILNLLKDKNLYLEHTGPFYYDSRKIIADSLLKLGPLELIVPLTAIENIYDEGESNYNTYFNNTNYRWRSYVYFLSGGSEEIKTLLRWIGKSKNVPKSFGSHEEAKKTLELFDKVWELSSDLPGVRGDLAPQIARVAKMVDWQLSDALLLEKHYKNLSDAKYDSADFVKSAIDKLEFWKWFNSTRTVIFSHMVFWAVLIFAYPKSSQVQAIFFWNPWVRRILGVGYVGFLLTWVPFLRHRLLAPFRASLIADAGLQNLPAAQTYFPSSEVIPRNGSDRQPLPAIKGQIILEGESGLGKTMFLRYLVKSSKRNIVYLTAKRCEKGVIEAIQAKLLLGDTVETNFLKDKNFLRNLIYSGAIDVCIDGLNEVTADTRAKITQFVEQNFKGNILLTTQPLIEWNPPGTANIYTLQPLRPDQIKQFLLSRPLPKDAHIKDTEYANACEELLSKFNLKTLPPGQSSPSAANSLNLPAEEAIAIKRVLSNPMDLTIVAQMLAVGENPDLFNLQNQQYQIMAADYEKKKLREFPLNKFAEIVYQMRLNDQEVIPIDKYGEELTIMEHHKMVVCQWRSGHKQKSSNQEKPNQEKPDQEKKEPIEEPIGDAEYLFRHDKIMEFFIVQTFLGDSDQVNTRLKDHISDPRFRGVYFLLATLLPLDAAQNLREQLIQYAANTKDHAVSDTFIQLLRSRSLVNN